MFLNLINKLRQRHFDAKLLIREIQKHELLNSTSFDCQSIYTPEICEQIIDCQTLPEARQRLCDFWQHGPLLASESYFMAALAVEKSHGGMCRMIASELWRLANTPYTGHEIGLEIGRIKVLIEKYAEHSPAFRETPNSLTTRHHELQFGGLFPVQSLTFFERSECESLLANGLVSLLEDPHNGCLIAWGTGGIGKTTLINHLVYRTSDFWISRGHLVDAVLWLNVCQFSIVPLFDEQGFLDALSELFLSVRLIDEVPSRKTTIPYLQSVLNSKKPRLLIVLDDVFCKGILRTMHRISCGVDTIRCVASTRNLSQATFGVPGQFKCSHLEIETLSQAALEQMLGSHYGLRHEKRLSTHQITKLAERCLGLPLIASVIESHFRPLFAPETIQAKFEKLVTTLKTVVRSEGEDENKDSVAKAKLNVAELLTFSPEFGDQSFKQMYYTFLILNAGESVDARDLAILYGLKSTMQIYEHCQRAVQASLLRPSFSKDSYVVHDILHRATVERAKQDFEVDDLSKIRQKLLTNLMISRPCVIQEIIQADRPKLLQLCLVYCDPEILANRMFDSDGAFSMLLKFARELKWNRSGDRPLSVVLFCQLADLCAEFKYEAMKSKFETENLLQLLPLRDGGKWFENICFAAIHLNCKHLLRFLLQLPNVKSSAAEWHDFNGDTLLIMSCRLSFPAICETILTSDMNIDFEAKNVRGQTALITCCAAATLANTTSSSFEITKLVIEAAKKRQKPLDIDAVDKNGNTALIEAARLGQTDIALYLIDVAGANLHIVNRMNRGNAFEISFAFYDVLLTCEMLVERGAYTAPNSPMAKALHSEVQKTPRAHNILNKAENNYLSLNQAVIPVFYQNVVSPGSWQAELCEKIEQKNFALLKVMFEDEIWKHRINEVCEVESGNTPLHVAASCCFSEFVDFLLDNGATVDQKNGNDDTPLLIACSKSFGGIGDLLFEKGHADPTIANAMKFSPFILACRNGLTQLVRKFLAFENCRNFIDAGNVNDNTALIFACNFGHLEIAKMLVENGAAVDKQTCGGDSPLHLAICRGHPTVVKWLLENAAPSVDAPNLKGITPIMYACEMGSVEMAKMLIEHNADVNLIPTNGLQSCLAAAKKSGNELLVELLIENGAIDHQQ